MAVPQLSCGLSPNDLPIMSISATSDLPATEFYQKMQGEYLPQIQQIKGVAELTILGGEEREIQVLVDENKLEYYNIPMLQIVEAINRSGLDIPAGKIENGSQSNSVKISSKYNTVEDIKNIQVAIFPPSTSIYIKDLAVVKDGIKEITSVSRYNGKNGIGILLKKQGDANAVDVSTKVKEKLKWIEDQNKESNVKFILADDSTDSTIAAVNSVVVDLIMAVLLVSLVMLLL